MEKITVFDLVLTPLPGYVYVKRGNRTHTYQHPSQSSLSRISIACKRQLLQGKGTIVPFFNGWAWVDVSLRGAP